MTMTMMVDANGRITTGQAIIDIGWSGHSTGEAPTTFDPYTVTSTHSLVAQMEMAGTIQRFMLSGTLTWDRAIRDSDGTVVTGDGEDDVPATRIVEAEWVFEARDSICGLLTGTLVEATGNVPIVSQVMLEPGIGDVTENTLFTISRGFPGGLDDSVDWEEVAADIRALNEITNDLVAAETVRVGEIVAFMVAVEELRARVARSEQCGVLLLPETGPSIFAAIMQDLMNKLLDDTDGVTTQNLIELMNLAARSGAVVGGEGAEALLRRFEQTPRRSIRAGRRRRRQRHDPRHRRRRGEVRPHRSRRGRVRLRGGRRGMIGHLRLVVIVVVASFGAVSCSSDSTGDEPTPATAAADQDGATDDESTGAGAGGSEPDDRPSGAPLIDDIPVIEALSPPNTGADPVPRFAWEPVEGAAAYDLVVVDSAGPLWAWRGTELEIRLGGPPGDRPAGGSGPVIGQAACWSVIAVDAEGHVVATSEHFPVSTAATASHECIAGVGVSST